MLLEDVKDQDIEVQPQGDETPAQDSQPDDQTPAAPAVESEDGGETPVETPTERTVPLSVVQKERKARQEAQRELAELKANAARGQIDPEDYDTWAANPLTQELMIKQAKTELTEYARETLDNYPTLPAAIKKSILKNVRGFVRESTTDVETAKVDLLEAIEDMAEEAGVTPTQMPEPAKVDETTKKGFPVAATNVPAANNNKANSAEVEAILAKPVDELEEEDEKIVADYQKRNAK